MTGSVTNLMFASVRNSGSWGAGGMIVVNSPDFVSFSDMDLLRALTSSDRRPNLMVDCTSGCLDEVLDHLRTICAEPFHCCRLPGRLDLPTGGTGTLMLHDVATLTIAQQVAL